MIEVTKTAFDGLCIIKPKVFNDSRGYFFESFNASDFEKNNLPFQFVQDNQSYSKFGTLRGLHFQLEPHAQTKLIRAVAGQILDVVVDLRPQSKTFKTTFTIELSSENQLQLLVPKGFAHGFVTLSETALVAYKCDALYSPSHDRGIAFNDPELKIDWKVPAHQLLLSEKDQKHPTLSDYLLKAEKI